jgi:hypothetical protein
MAYYGRPYTGTVAVTVSIAEPFTITISVSITEPIPVSIAVPKFNSIVIITLKAARAAEALIANPSAHSRDLLRNAQFVQSWSYTGRAAETHCIRPAG